MPDQNSGRVLMPDHNQTGKVMTLDPALQVRGHRHLWTQVRRWSSRIGYLTAILGAFGVVVSGVATAVRVWGAMATKTDVDQAIVQHAKAHEPLQRLTAEVQEHDKEIAVLTAESRDAKAERKVVLNQLYEVARSVGARRVTREDVDRSIDAETTPSPPTMRPANPPRRGPR